MRHRPMTRLIAQWALQDKKIVEGMLGINGQWALQYRQMVEGMLGINGQ
jgi:hypothetical protein